MHIPAGNLKTFREEGEDGGWWSLRVKIFFFLFFSRQTKRGGLLLRTMNKKYLDKCLEALSLFLTTKAQVLPVQSN